MLEDKLVSILKQFSGWRQIDLDALIGRDIGIYGGDSIDLLYKLEDEFKVDLNPLVDKYAIPLKPTWIDKIVGRKSGSFVSDVSARELIDYVRQPGKQDWDAGSSG